MNVSQVLPKGQKEILRKALSMLDEALKGFDQECEVVEYQRHDIISLKAFLDYDVSVTLSKERKENFAFIHKVDFPEYTGVDAQYPIEAEVDDREFQVTHLKTHYEPTTDIKDINDFYDNGYTYEDINEIKGLDISDLYKTEGVIIVRLN